MYYSTCGRLIRSRWGASRHDNNLGQDVNLLEKWTNKMSEATQFDVNCRRCERLASFLDEVAAEYPDYHARPVAPFGAKKPKLLIVGLAPGLLASF